MKRSTRTTEGTNLQVIALVFQPLKVGVNKMKFTIENSSRQTEIFKCRLRICIKARKNRNL